MSEPRNFENYDLSSDVYELADDLLPAMAKAFDVELGNSANEESMQNLIGEIGPAKFLQDNIGIVQDRLGRSGTAIEIAADWVERSGVLVPTRRSFASSEIVFPTQFDAAMISGGVARWMLRRANKLKAEVNSGTQIGTVYLSAGTRQMRETEHGLVGEYAKQQGSLPTEREFAATYIASALRESGLRAKLFEQDTSEGDDLMSQFAREVSGAESFLVVSNAPAAIQTAGQFRVAARAVNDGFDRDGDQLYMVADGIGVARAGEGPATHQNPFTALGQIARNALFLHRNQT